MSTNFLNRRMDLIHSVVDDINYLTMDTSYPVKLAGLVIKLFTATQNYNKQQFVICNSDKEEILTISTDKIYDFAGRVINDSIGIEEAYKSEEDVYIKDDYVMVIIDFNDKNIHLCSQTNFKMFITAGVDDFCNFKLFDITGDTEVEGFDYPINVDEFDNAYNFEQKKVGHHSFLRHDEDDVVYQVPEIIGTGDDIERSMVPVANVENININRLNVSISQLTFPFINIPSGDCGLDNVSSIMSYYTINGKVNDKFIEEYCFTYDEIKSLKLYTDLSKIPNSQILTELNMILEDKRNDYVYVVRTNCYNNEYDSPYFNTNDIITITAINKDTKSFCNYMILSNNGIKCGNSSVSIAINKLGAYNLIGNWWSSDSNNGFFFYLFENKFDIIGENTAGIQIRRGRNSELITNTYDKNGNTNNNESGMYYIDYINNIGTNKTSYLTYNITNFLRIYMGDDNYKPTEAMKKLNRFIDFFANDDRYYYEHFIKYSLSPSFSNTYGDSFGLSYCNHDPNAEIPVTINKDTSPICVVGVYPELFEDTMFNITDGNYDNTNIHNFTSFHNNIVTDPIDDTNRTKYKYNRYNASTNNRYNNSLAYELIDRGTTSGYYKEHEGNYLKANITNVTDENCKRYKYLSNRSLNSTSFSNFVIKRNIDGDIDDLLMCSIVSVIIANCINTPYDNTQPYNNAEMILQYFVVNKSVKRAIQHIEISSDNKLIYHPNGIGDDTETYELYTIVNKDGNNSEFLWQQATNTFKTSSGSDQKGLCYLYYLKGSNSDTKGKVHRIKYFYNGRSIESDTIPKFDYFTDSMLFDRDDVVENDRKNALFQKIKSSPTAHMIIRAYLNQDMILNENSENTTCQKFCDTSSNNNWHEILIDIVKAYHFFPYNIGNASEDNKQTILNFYTTSFSNSNTANLTIGIDDMVDYPANVNNPNMNNGTGFRLKDIINDDKIIYYQNSLVPYVSDIKDSNNSYIYTMRTYINYIKNHKVNDFFYTKLFEYVNGVGIREEYYKDKSIYDFYNYVLTRDLSKPNSDTTYLKVNGDRAFFKKDIISKIYSAEKNNDDGLYYFKDENGNNFNLTVKNNNGITLNANINTHNIFGFNESTLINSDNTDMTENYIDVEKVNMNVVETGLKRIYTISMSDGLYNTAMMPVNGSSDSIDTDTLNWNDLLLALNNDKRIDMLSESLMRIKSELNDYIVDNAQNISDIYSIEENNRTEENAKKKDDIFDVNSPYYKETNAEFDNAHNVYKFNYGYGFEYPGSYNKRESKNRGVIVFVSEGGSINRDKHGSIDDPSRFTYSYDEHTKIYPKRMYISKDGLLCTKEYYDREVATKKALEERIKTLEEKLGINN